MQNICRANQAPWKNTVLQALMGPFLKALQWTLKFPGTLHLPFWKLCADDPFGFHKSTWAVHSPKGGEKWVVGWSWGAVEEDRGWGEKCSESSSSKSTLGCYLLIVKRRWITSLGLWQVSWDEKKGLSKCMQPSPVIPLITCNIVAGYFCHTESDWWSWL